MTTLFFNWSVYRSRFSHKYRISWISAWALITNFGQSGRALIGRRALNREKEGGRLLSFSL